jgi:hypothetical protein
MERFLRGFSHDFESTSLRKKYANCRERIILKTGKCLVNAQTRQVESLTSGARQMRPGIRIVEELWDYNHPVILLAGQNLRE